MEMERKVRKTMGPVEAIISGWKNKWNFAGRASRAEFWWNTLVLLILGFVIGMVVIISIGLLSLSVPTLPMPETVWYVMGVLCVLLTVVFTALLSRRLHDAGHSNKCGIALVVLTPLAVVCSFFTTVMFFPEVVEPDSEFAWSDLLKEWDTAFIFGGSFAVCVGYLLLLAYVVPLIFKKGVVDNADNVVEERAEDDLCRQEDTAGSTDLMANWKVKLKVFFDYDYKIEEDTGRFLKTYRPTKYEFTFAEALKYISDNDRYYEVDDLLLHNVVVRDAMRRLGVSAVIEHIKTFAPADEKLLRELEKFQSDYPDGSIADYDIQVHSVFEDVQILGHTFCGLNDIVAHEEMMLNERSDSKDRAYSRTPQKRSNVHVGEVWASYPCFDAEDYANENRTYQNYIVRERPITNEDLQKLKALPSRGNYERINEKLPVSMLPMVYYQGDGCYMLIATEKRK